MVGALVVTHGNVARELVNAAYRIVGEQAALQAVCIGWDEDVAAARHKIEEAIQRVDRGSGVLIFTDMFGGTASNLSLTLLDPGRVEVVTGVNLSMLLKLGSEATSRLGLPELAEAVCGRGRESIQIPSRALRSRAEPQSGAQAGSQGSKHGSGREGAR
jgi:mannose PTS system EIIA component